MEDPGFFRETQRVVASYPSIGGVITPSPIVGSLFLSVPLHFRMACIPVKKVCHG
jgi:hypothetical protein